MKLTLREGWTERIEADLANNGRAFVLTDFTVSLVGEDKHGNAVTFSDPKVGIINATNGQVFCDFADGDLTKEKSPYQVRFKVVDTFSKVAFFPRIGTIELEIQNP